MSNGQTQTQAGVSIQAVPEYNITPDRLQFHPKGRDNGYVLNFGGNAFTSRATPKARRNCARSRTSTSPSCR